MSSVSPSAQLSPQFAPIMNPSVSITDSSTNITTSDSNFSSNQTKSNEQINIEKINNNNNTINDNNNNNNKDGSWFGRLFSSANTSQPKNRPFSPNQTDFNVPADGSPAKVKKMNKLPSTRTIR